MVACDIAPTDVIDKTRFVKNDVAKVVFDNNQYVWNRSPHISQQTLQFKMGKYANHNGYVDFFTDLTNTCGIKEKEKCFMHYIPGHPVVYPFCNDSLMNKLWSWHMVI